MVAIRLVIVVLDLLDRELDDGDETEWPILYDPLRDDRLSRQNGAPSNAEPGAAGTCTTLAE